MNIRERILLSNSANFLNKAKSEIIDELRSLTSFLPINYQNAIRYWYVKNEKTTLQTCKCCDIEPNFMIPRSNIKASEKWKIDQDKINLAESHGYKVLVIWESEFANNEKETIEKCVNFLKD